MTIVAGINEGAAHRVEANLYKLVNVLSVEDVTHVSTIARSLALIKVEAHEESRHRLMEIVRVFRARVVDLAPRSLIVQITGTEDKIQALVEVLRPFGILEMVANRASGNVSRRERRSSASKSARPKTQQRQRKFRIPSNSRGGTRFRIIGSLPSRRFEWLRFIRTTRQISPSSRQRKLRSLATVRRATRTR